MINNFVEVGDKIELIKKRRAKKRELPYYSKIQDIKSNNEIIITAPTENGIIVPLMINSEFYLCIYTSKGLYKCDAEVIGRKREGRLFLATLKIKSNMQKYQRRQYYRLDCVINFKYKLIDSEEWENGIILDISGGGLRFTSNKELNKGNLLACNIELKIEDEIKNINIVGTIIDSSIVEKNTKSYETRIHFDKISNAERELVIRFIFEEERVRRKKEKGM